MENQCRLGAIQSVSAQTRSKSEGKITLSLVYCVTQLILLQKSFSSCLPFRFECPLIDVNSQSPNLSSRIRPTSPCLRRLLFYIVLSSELLLTALVFRPFVLPFLFTNNLTAFDERGRPATTASSSTSTVQRSKCVISLFLLCSQSSHTEM